MSVPTIAPAEFCRKWLHPYRDIHPHERGFASECSFVIGQLTGYNFSTVNHWLNGISHPPEAVNRYLGLIDFILDRELSGENEFLNGLRRQYIEIMTMNR